MSILIKGVEMPKNCVSCKLWMMQIIGGKGFDICRASDKFVNAPYSKPDWCPLVEVPEQHGRLISADELIEFIENRYEITWKDDYEGGIKDACVDILEKISTMPTVIQASGTEVE